MNRRISTGSIVLLLVLAAAPLCAQSLADLSKAEEARRKTITTPSKVYTDKDLKAAPPPTTDADATPADPNAPAQDASKDAASDQDAKPADAKAGDAKAADAKPAEVKPGEVRDQAYWAGKAKELQAQLERDQSYSEALQARINALTTDFANRSDPAQRATVEQDRNKALAEAERLTQAIENDHKAISDLEDEARRSGVPPGWMR